MHPTKQEEAQQRRKDLEAERVARLVAEKREDRSNYLAKRSAITAKLKAKRDVIHSQRSARSSSPKSVGFRANRGDSL